MATGGAKSDVIRYGYVEFKSLHLGSYRRRWLVLYGGTADSPARLVKYTDEKEVKKSPLGRRQFFFNDVISAERHTKRDKGVRVRLKTEKCKEICFTVDSEASANDWVTEIQREIGGNRDTFPALIVQATHININGHVQLCIRDSHVIFIQEGLQALTIPLTTIRRYQMDDGGVFWIETGRSSPTGEGFVYFRSDFAYCILARLDGEARQPDQLRRPSDVDVQQEIGFSPNPAPHPQQNLQYVPGPPEPKPKPKPRDRFTSDSQVPHQTRPLPQPRDNYPMIPTARSQPQLNRGENFDRDRGFGQTREYWTDPRSLGRSREAEDPRRFQRKDSGTRLVAADPNSFPRQTNPQYPYLPMANTANKQFKAPNPISEEERVSYADMFSPDRDSDQRDYLTPTHQHPNARYGPDNRNS